MTLTGAQQQTTARAWRCDDCTRLTIRLDREVRPVKCDRPNCTGALHEAVLRPAGSRP